MNGSSGCRRGGRAAGDLVSEEIPVVVVVVVVLVAAAVAVPAAAAASAARARRGPLIITEFTVCPDRGGPQPGRNRPLAVQH